MLFRSVNIMTIKGDATDENGYPTYGSFEFQGVYLYKIDLTAGFKLTGKVTHLSKDDYLKAGDAGADYTKFVERALYIGDNLYTASQRYIKANAIGDMSDIGWVEIGK